MKCIDCGAWTEVSETRTADRGHTVRRRRRCANGHMFDSFEVYAPIYRNDKPRVRSCVHAADARAVRYRRNLVVLADLRGGMTNADVARKHHMKPSLVAFIKAWGLK